MRPPFIGHYTEFLDDDDASYPGSTELLSIGSAVGRNLGLKKIGIHIETLLPGRRTSYPHAESEEEEFAYVIEGNPHAWINGELHPLKPGDFVAFSSGTGISHTFINNSNQKALLLVGGEARKATNKIIYPLNDEINLIRKTQETLWENPPRHPMGPHDGKPDLHSPKWNLPVLETKRLTLRALELSDAPNIFKYASNPEVAKFVTWPAHESVTDSENYIKFVHNNYLFGVQTFAICLKEDPQTMLGDASSFFVSKPNKVMELGAVLNPDHWGKGIMVEALEAIIKHTWQTQDVVRIQARCFQGNKQSYRMMQKLGMHYEGTILKSLFAKNQSWDMEMFSLLK